jgi:DtxR family Mn-dependent transcriptional regulator
MATYQTPEYHPAFEEYCETIFELAEDEVEVIQARIAERLGISRPAVSEMIRRLEHNGLVTIDRGRIERFLTDVLHLSWAEAHQEAGRWEHVISETVEAAMIKLLGEPTTCPHGNPIPGTDYAEPSDARHLAELEVGEVFTIRRIPEELEFTPGLLAFLEESDIVPHRTGTVTAIAPDRTITVRIGDRPVGIDSFAASRILVTTA